MTYEGDIADILLCKDEECNKKHICMRYLMKPFVWSVYFRETPRVKQRCKKFISMTLESKMNHRKQ